MSAVPVAHPPLDEAIDRVNEMFRAKGIDVNPDSVPGFITTFWGFLDANDEAVAMAKNNFRQAQVPKSGQAIRRGQTCLEARCSDGSRSARPAL